MLIQIIYHMLFSFWFSRHTFVIWIIYMKFIFNMLTYNIAYESGHNKQSHIKWKFLNWHMYFYFKNAVRAHMERPAQTSVQNIVYTINPVTTLMEPVPTVVKMDT